MKTRLVVALMVLSGAAAGQFDQFTWTLTGNSTGSGSLTPATMHVVGPDAWLCDEHVTYFEATAPVGGSIAVTVDFQNLDGWAIAHPSYDAPVGIRNGELLKAPPVGVGTPGWGWPTGQYQLEFNVAAGDRFGFGVWSLDCVEGPGVADFHDLTFTPLPWSGQPLELDPRVRFTVTGVPSPTVGLKAAAAGDVNADGTPDIIAGFSLGHTVHVLSGRDGSLLLDLSGPGFGRVVGGAGDVNSDGFDDAIVGSPTDSVAGVNNAGSATVFSGQGGSVLFKFFGSAEGDQLGAAVIGMGDANSDGFDDVAVTLAKPNADFDVVKIFSGATGLKLHEIKAPAKDIDFGRCLSGAGDVDADGSDDLVIGMMGAAYVYSGATGAVLELWTGSSTFGAAVSGAGDVDGDGHADVVVGVPGFEQDGVELGRVRLFSGATGGEMLSIVGVEVGASFGSSVSGGGDLNGDGHLDLVVGAPGEGLGGVVRVFDGLDGSEVAELGAHFQDDVMSIVDVLGDVDADGRADLVVAAYLGGATDEGYVRVYQRLHHPGPPSLTGEGDLVPNLPVTLNVTNAPPSAPAFLVVGGALVQLPCLGGVLAPSPDLIIPFITSPTGQVQLVGRWPAGLPTWFTAWLQIWAQDPDGPRGFSASHAVAASQL